MPRTNDVATRVRTVVVLSDAAFVDGGGAAVGLRSAVALARAGLRVEVVAATGPPMPELLGEPNLRVVCTGQERLASSLLGGLRQGLWNERSAALLDRTLSGCDPSETIVHVHGWTKALSPSIFHVATRRGFTAIVTLHDYFSICPNGSLYLHNDDAICKLTPMSVRCITTDCDSRNYAVKGYRVVRQVVQRYIAGMPGAVNAFISVSDFSRAIIEPHLPANARIYPVTNPVDRVQTAAASPELSSRFLYLGRLSPEKGPALFARAALDAGVQADFAGEGPCTAEISAVNPSARLLGWLDASQVTAELGASRALVLPSLWYETYGLSVMEAAASGVPAIVPDTSAARDLVVPSETGLWFEGGNAASLSAALRELSRPGVAGRMGAAAYERYWSDPPTMAKHVARLREVYDSALTRARG